MIDAPITVLLVEDAPADASLIQAGLAGAKDGSFRVEWVTRLDDALQRLGRDGVEVIMLDLTLADGQGLEVFDRVVEAAPNALILILSEARDEAVARQAVQRGAHDYLLKDRIDTHWLSRSLRYVLDNKAARDALHNSEARFRAMSDASPLGIFVSDAQGVCSYTNAAYQRISGLSSDQTLGTCWSTTIHPEDRQRVLADWCAAAQSDAPLRTEFRLQREDGSIVWTRVNSAAMRDGMAPHGHVLTVEDITARKATEFGLRAAEEALFEEKERARVTLNSIGDAVLTTDLLGNVTYLNPVAETMSGWSGEDALGRPLAEVFRIIDGTTRRVAVNPAQRALEEDRTVGLAADCVLIRRDGFESAIEDSAAPIHNRDGQVAGAVIVFHDVSQSRAMAAKMAHLAQHDFLTGLPNRALLTDRLSQAIGLAHRHCKQVALLYIDLDDFKHINDSLGHAIGDQLLQSVAERLVACVRSTDMVCRQGGDEFVVLLAEIERPQDADLVAETLLAAFVAPHLIDGRELHVTPSIGISVYPDDGADADSVMQNADTAMFHAKASGRNNYQFFRAEMNIRAVRRLAVESSLRRALKEGEFLLHYQPQIDLASGAMIGAEALIRWRDPNLGVVYPGQFVPIAEECGLIVPIGRWVLREACRQVRVWLDAGLRAVPVAVNISAVEFRHKGFLAGVALILQETGLAPAYLELELTESILMHDAVSSAAVLEALKDMGVRLAIDDFGTGYSSLSYLKRFPIDTLKIDQSFVRDIVTDTDDATIVAAVIGMGKSLKQRVIAEGVETHEQLAFLRNQDCDEGQGFHFSHSLSAAAFGLLLEAENADQEEGGAQMGHTTDRSASESPALTQSQPGEVTP
jgi:diguanylate cyclase (GGDEF)-like protein/PAS domain S-box-containing protein